MKSGEQEAKQILQSKNIKFDDVYYDDNSKSSMPDLRYANGRYLEVTHTYHNSNIYGNEFYSKTADDKQKIIAKVNEAYDRIKNIDYPRILNGLTKEGYEKYSNDKNLIKSHWGIDISDNTKTSEFKCDIPIIECSADNIICAVQRKAKKYPDGNTDLFIFILEDEFECIKHLFQTKDWNGCYNEFMNTIMQSPFKIVYLCVWDFESQAYNVTNPILLKFDTLSDKKLACSEILFD